MHKTVYAAFWRNCGRWFYTGPLSTFEWQNFLWTVQCCESSIVWEPPPPSFYYFSSTMFLPVSNIQQLNMWLTLWKRCFHCRFGKCIYFDTARNCHILVQRLFIENMNCGEMGTFSLSTFIFVIWICTIQWLMETQLLWTYRSLGRNICH